MKREYDMSNSERGKFYRPGQKLIPPIHLDSGVLDRLSALAQRRGVTLDELANELLDRQLKAAVPAE